MNQTKQSVVYIRPPKTGSSSVVSLFDGVADRRSRISSYKMDVAMKARGTPTGTNVVSFGNRTPLRHEERFKFALSHWPFCFDKKFYENVMIGEPVFITVLREPVAWWISLFNMECRNPGDERPSIDDLISWLQRPDDFVPRHYAVYLTSPAGERSVSAAMRNLEDIDIVGVTEDMNQLFLAVCERFELPLKFPHVSSRTKPERCLKLEDVPGDIVSEIERMISEDREIHNAATMISRRRGAD